MFAWEINLTQRWTQSGFFKKKSEHFFWFSKNDRGSLHPSPLSCTPWVWMNKDQYLNIPKYCWKCLHNAMCQGFEYACSSYMFNRVFKKPWVWNVSEFWIWHGCICKCYTKIWICLNLAQYTSVMPEYVAICLNILQYA